MRKKEDKRTIRTKEQIKKAFFHLLRDGNTFSDIKITDITDMAKINRVTFYSHFNDKYELVNEMARDCKKELQDLADINVKYYPGESYYISRAKSLGMSLIQICYKYKDIIYGFRKEENSIILYMLQEEAKDLFSNLLNEVAKDHRLKYPVSMISSFVVNGFTQVIHTWLFEEKNSSIEEHINHIDSLMSDLFSNKVLFY